jgi:hypothetical protein
MRAIRPAFNQIRNKQRSMNEGKKQSDSVESGFAIQWLLPRSLHLKKPTRAWMISVQPTGRLIYCLLDFAMTRAGDYPGLESVVNDKTPGL